MDVDALKEISSYLEQMMGQYYQTDYGVTKFDGLVSLLSDVMHYCDSQGIRYNAVVNAAKWHYQHNNFKSGEFV